MDTFDFTNNDTMSFQTVHEFIRLAKAAYHDTKEEIHQLLPQFTLDNIVIIPTPESAGSAIILFDEVTKSQYIAIRGTHNIKNGIIDAKYHKVLDPITRIKIHKGFYETAQETYKLIYSLLRDDYTTYITGHSLGGAVAAILHLFFHEEGRKLKENAKIKVRFSMTFGQPKFTDRKGMKKYSNIPLLRIIDQRDIVPLLPPTTLWQKIFLRQFGHFGTEVVLLDTHFYSSLNKHRAKNFKVTSFWRHLLADGVSLSDHHMDHYEPRIFHKTEKNVYIPFKKRSLYMKLKAIAATKEAAATKQP